MPVNSVTNKRENKTSYFFATTFGLACGYSAKWLLPLNKHEKDDEYMGKLRNIAELAKKARKDEIEAIKKAKPIGTDEFLSIYNKTAKDIKKPFSVNVTELFNRINEKALIVKQNEIIKLKTSTKYIRPTFPFLLIGGSIGFLYAIAKNITNISTNNTNT